MNHPPSMGQQLKFALAIGLPLAFASGLVVAGLILLAMLEFGVADRLARLESRWHGEPRTEGTALRSASNDMRMAPGMGSRPGDTGSVVAMVLLEEELAAAREEREGLLGEIRALTDRLQELEDGGESAVGAASAAAVGGAPNPDAGTRDTRTENERQIDALLAAGIDLGTAEAFQRQNDQIALARLELYDRASREGWADSDEFEQELAALDEARGDARELLGDDGFDRYLHAAGRPNRVAIDSVIGGSAAAAAGLEAGDRIESYAGRRIYTLPELQLATREGTRGENVQVIVVRDGEAMLVDIPRGPLGVTLAAGREAPPGS